MPLRNPSRDKLTGERDKKNKWGFSTCTWQARMRILLLEQYALVTSLSPFASNNTRERRRIFNNGRSGEFMVDVGFGRL